MKTYKVFLTKNREVSSLLADALWKQYKQNEECSSGFGYADNDDRIPELYHDCGYFYAMVEYKSEQPKYELIFA